MSKHSVGEVIAKYLELRNELDDRRHEWQDFERDHKLHMERLSMWLRDRADELDVESFKTSSGTAYRSFKEYVRIADWDSFIKFVKKTDNFQMLEKRVAKRASLDLLTEEKMEASDIGLEYSADVDFLVRKPSK